MNSSILETPQRAPANVRIAGYAAIFDQIDKGGDIIRYCAFDHIATDIPLLWQHDPQQKIGRIDYLKVDRRGLRVIASLSADNSMAAEASQLLRSGAVNGLSFGYHVQESRGEKPRELLNLDVAEISLVTFPMQPLAMVHLIEE